MSNRVNRLREQNGEGSHSESYGDDKMPWEKQSNFDPPPGENKVLEDFLTQVFQYLFNPKNSRKFVDNLTKEERGALKEISKWNGDRANPRVIQGDKTTFRVDGVDISQENSHKVFQWARKWGREGVLEESVCNWIVVENPKPAKLYANVKTHKENWLYRFIMSSRGTAIENLARLLEIQLKPYARLHEAYIKDTKSFLRHLEELNDTRAPFKESTKLLRWDIKNYYPNCSTELCVRAVKRILDERGTNLPQNSKNCILEALSITMSSYNGQFLGELFTQTDGATIGGPESASVTDIFGAVYIDEMARQGNEHLQPSDWRRMTPGILRKTVTMTVQNGLQTILMRIYLETKSSLSWYLREQG